MLSLTFTILPVFLLLIFGVILRRIRFPFDDFWSGVDKLVYWILFPAMLFNKTSQIDFNNPTLPHYALVLLVALFVTAMYIFSVNRAFKVDPPTASSMLQAGVRFNTFIVLAVAEALYSSEGLVFAALGAAILIPTVNVFLVISMVLMHGNKQLKISQLLIKELLKNPLIMSIAAGVSINLLGYAPVIIISEMTQILSQATLPLVLLAVGASLRFGDIRHSLLLFGLSGIGRMCIFPVSISLMCILLNVTGVAAAVAVIFGAVPTATSALARQLGGNAQIMAVFISLQTAISLITLPVTMWLAQWYFIA